MFTDDQINNSLTYKSCPYKTKCLFSGKMIYPGDIAIYCSISSKYYHIESELKNSMPQPKERRLKLISRKLKK